MVRKPNGIYKLVDIFKKVSVGLKTTEPRTDIDNIIKVNSFKKLIMLLIKKIVYTIISNKCRIYKDKSTMWMNKLSNQYLFDFMQKMNYPHLKRMFMDLEKTLEIRVKEFC